MADSLEELLKGSPVTGSINDLPGHAAQKSLLMIFIVDISGSMSGERIDRVNEAFRTMVPTLQQIQTEVNDAFELSIAVLTFGTNAQWIVPPTPIMAYFHEDLRADGGGTQYGTMLRELQSKLSRQAYMAHKGKIAAPYIMLMTDGKPLDSDYETVIQELQNNLWYFHAQRYAVLIGRKAINDAKARSAVQAFVSDAREGIVTAEDAQAIVETVSAKTIHTVRLMTRRGGLSAEDGAESRKNQGAGGYKGDEWEFPEGPDAIYGGDFVF